MCSRFLRIAFVSLVTVAAVAFYLHTTTPHVTDHHAIEPHSNATVKVGKTYGQATIGGHFDLIDQHGQPKTDANFKGKFMVVYFGYSFCPDICPAALYNMTEAFNTLTKKELSQFAPLFISVDPKRDTVTNLNTYMGNFHPAILGLTGSEKAVESAKKAYRVYAQKATPDGTSTEYLIDHSSIVYLMDRQGRFITSFNHQTDPETILKTLRAVL